MHATAGHNQCFNEYLNLPYLSFGKGQIKEHHSIDNFLNYKMLIYKKGHFRIYENNLRLYIVKSNKSTLDRFRLISLCSHDMFTK